jgi:hypothetical protein
MLLSIFAKTDLFHGNCPNLDKLFSSISTIMTSEFCFLKGNIFWYKSKLRKETDLTMLGLLIFKDIKRIKIKTYVR